MSHLSYVAAGTLCENNADGGAPVPTNVAQFELAAESLHLRAVVRLC